MTWQPTCPSRQSESLSAKEIQWQLRPGNIGRSDSVKDDEKYSEHYHYHCTENRVQGEEDEKRTNDAATKCKKVRMQRQREKWVERHFVGGWIEL